MVRLFGTCTDSIVASKRGLYLRYNFLIIVNPSVSTYVGKVATILRALFSSGIILSSIFKDCSHVFLPHLYLSDEKCLEVSRTSGCCIQRVQQKWQSRNSCIDMGSSFS